MSYFCDKCKKSYASYHSYWTHNKLSHSENNKREKDGISCDYCNNKYFNKYSLNRHLLKCSIKIYNERTTNDIKITNKQITNNQSDNLINEEIINNNENLKLKIQLIEIENKNLELKLKFEKLLQNKCRMHPKTFKSLNNKLINNSMNNNTINNNNNITNNFKIYTIGKENLIDILTLSEKNDIMRSRYNCLERIVEIAHCSKYDQFKNIIITNLKDNHAYKYDDSKGYFVCINKNEVINNLVHERLGDIKEIYEELSTTNKLDINTKHLIKEFLNKINVEDSYKDDTNGIIYPNFKSYNEQKVKILIYNNTDKINQDLTIIFDSLPDIRLND